LTPALLSLFEIPSDACHKVCIIEKYRNRKYTRKMNAIRAEESATFGA
jgi:hypothetical protein